MDTVWSEHPDHTSVEQTHRHCLTCEVPLRESPQLHRESVTGHMNTAEPFFMSSVTLILFILWPLWEMEKTIFVLSSNTNDDVASWWPHLSHCATNTPSSGPWFKLTTTTLTIPEGCFIMFILYVYVVNAVKTFNKCFLFWRQNLVSSVAGTGFMSSLQETSCQPHQSESESNFHLEEPAVGWRPLWCRSTVTSLTVIHRHVGTLPLLPRLRPAV